MNPIQENNNTNKTTSKTTTPTQRAAENGPKSSLQSSTTQSGKNTTSSNKSTYKDLLTSTSSKNPTSQIRITPNDELFDKMIHLYQQKSTSGEPLNPEDIMNILGNPLCNADDAKLFTFFLYVPKFRRNVKKKDLGKVFYECNRSDPIWNDLIIKNKIRQIQPKGKFGISITIAGSETKNQIQGKTFKLNEQVLTVPKHSRYENCYWIELIRLPNKVKMEEIIRTLLTYKWEIYGYKDTELTKNNISDGTLRIYFNSIECPSFLKNNNVPIREIQFPTLDNPIYIKHRYPKYNELIPPSILQYQQQRQKHHNKQPPNTPNNINPTPPPTNTTINPIKDNNIINNKRKHQTINATNIPPTTEQDPIIMDTDDEDDLNDEPKDINKPQSQQPQPWNTITSKHQNKNIDTFHTFLNSKELTTELQTLTLSNQFQVLNDILEIENEDEDDYVYIIEKDQSITTTNTQKENILKKPTGWGKSKYSTTKKSYGDGTQLTETQIKTIPTLWNQEDIDRTTAYASLTTQLNNPTNYNPIKQLRSIQLQTMLFRKVFLRYCTKLQYTIPHYHLLIRLLTTPPIQSKSTQYPSIITKEFPTIDINNPLNSIDNLLLQLPDYFKNSYNHAVNLALADIIIMIICPEIYSNDQQLQQLFNLHHDYPIRLPKYGLLNDTLILLIMNSTIGQQILNNNKLPKSIKNSLTQLPEIQEINIYKHSIHTLAIKFALF